MRMGVDVLPARLALAIRIVQTGNDLRSARPASAARPGKRRTFANCPKICRCPKNGQACVRSRL